jgi:hypothetical protein
MAEGRDSKRPKWQSCNRFLKLVRLKFNYTLIFKGLLIYMQSFAYYKRNKLERNLSL